MKKAGELYDQASGRVMMFLPTCLEFSYIPETTLTTMPAGKRRKALSQPFVMSRNAIFPDSVHHPDFPFHNLKPGETYQHTTIYKFSVK